MHQRLLLLFSYHTENYCFNSLNNLNNKLRLNNLKQKNSSKISFFIQQRYFVSFETYRESELPL